MGSRGESQLHLGWIAAGRRQGLEAMALAIPPNPPGSRPRPDSDGAVSRHHLGGIAAGRRQGLEAMALAIPPNPPGSRPRPDSDGAVSRHHLGGIPAGRRQGLEAMALAISPAPPAHDRPPDLDGAVSLELVLVDLLAQRVAVNPEVLGRPREVSAVALQDPQDEPFLELATRVGEEDPLVDHLRDQRVQLLLHGMTLPLCRDGLTRPSRS